MGIGAIGLSFQNVLPRVVLENERDTGNVIHQHLYMADYRVSVSVMIPLKDAIRNLAQVSTMRYL